MSPKSPTDAVSKAVQLPASIDPPGPDNPPKEAVWIIFGATGHIGRSLARAALRHGDKVAAVGRTFESTKDQMCGWHENCHGLLCDVRVRESVEAVVKDTIHHFGRVDVIANCTGYGVVAAAEDQSPHDLQNQFSTNFMGTLHILQSSLSYFRTNNIPGRYLILSSTAGALGVPGLAPYCASKYAVEGLIESMLYEVDTFRIKATLVEPGFLRDDDVKLADEPTASPINQPSGLQEDSIQQRLQTGSKDADKIKRYGHFFVKPNPSPPYDNPTSPSGHTKRTFQWLDVRQPSSTVRSAELIWQLAHSSYPPLRLLLGNYAVESIRDRLRSVTEEIEDWKHLNFPIPEGGPDFNKTPDGRTSEDYHMDADDDDAQGDDD